MGKEKLQRILTPRQRGAGLFLTEVTDSHLELWQSLAKTPNGARCLPVRRRVFTQAEKNRTIQEEAQRWIGKEVL